MSSVTGVELGPDYCVLVHARKRGGSIELAGVKTFEPFEWPDDLRERILLLQEARHELGLPRPTTVVAWELAAFSMRSGEAMLRQAGFAVRNVLSPPRALALLAWSRPGTLADGASAAWLSMNRHGAALVVVRQFELLYAREFAWRIRASERRNQAHLLRRYLYVAQTVPEMRRASDVVREQYGATISVAVTCGNIPDLRSLTMPLIEELNIEFETLDSLDGLQVAPAVGATIAQSASSLRLAVAAAAADADTGLRSGSFRRWVNAAAALVLVAGAWWWAIPLWSGRGSPGDEPPRERRPIVSEQGRGERPPAPRDVTLPPAGSLQSPPATSPRATTGVLDVARASSPASESPPSAVPSVSGILISSDRRLAVINGVVVGVGDRVGDRVVARIDPDGVLFRDSSGRLVRVPVKVRNNDSR